MTGLQELKKIHCDSIRKKFPSLPESAICAGKYSDNSANALTKSIVAYITLSGGHATRVSSTGRQITKHRTEVKGSGKLVYIPGTTRKGTADIHAVWKGKHLSIEVKIGKDRQSEAQKQVEIEVNRAGGYYFIAKYFETFYQWINQL